MRTICIFGDSIAWGAHDPDGGGWVTRLRGYFEREGDVSGEYINIYNLGISGDNSRRLAQRFRGECTARGADGVILAIGVNDAVRANSDTPYNVPIVEFESHMRSVVEWANETGMQIFILGLTRADELKTTPTSWDEDVSYYNEDIEMYERVLKKIAEETPSTFIDIAQIVTEDDLFDGLHPNSQGHEKMFECVKAALMRSMRS